VETPNSGAFALRDYQVEHAQTILAALRSSAYAALDASDTGTGKTFVALACAKALGAVPVVIAPKATIPSWRKAANLVGVDIDVQGYEKIRSPKSEYGEKIQWGSGSFWKWAHDFEMMIFDEVDRCSGMTTLNSKMLIAAKRQCRYVLGLSATAAESPLHLKALGFALGLHNLKDYKWWLMRHGVAPGIWGGYEFTPNEVEQREHMRRIHHQIFPSRGGRMRKANIPGFPKTQIGVLLLDDEGGKAARLGEALAVSYTKHRAEIEAAEAWEEAMEIARQDEDWAMIATLEETRPDTLTILTRRRQSLELLKVEAFTEFAVDYAKTSKVVCFVNYKETFEALKKSLSDAFGVEIPGIDGETPDDLREAYKDEFQHNQHPALVANAAACGVGIGFHDPYEQTDRTALISPMYSARLAKQVVGRLPRDGGGFSTQFFCYFATGTEAAIAEVLARKSANLDTFNDLTDADLLGLK
jgi:superfamily II DNA or RNA helicase